MVCGIWQQFIQLERSARFEQFLLPHWPRKGPNKASSRAAMFDEKQIVLANTHLAGFPWTPTLSCSCWTPTQSYIQLLDTPFLPSSLLAPSPSSLPPNPPFLSCPPFSTAVMRKFNHPHIIKLFGVISYQSMTFIIMELAPLGQVGEEGGRGRGGDLVFLVPIFFVHVFAVDCTRNTIAVVHTIGVNFKAVVIPPGHLIWTIYNGLCGTVTISPPQVVLPCNSLC